MTQRTPWWKGMRGEWYVVVQLLLFALVVFGPRALPGGASETASAPLARRAIAAVLLGSGLLLVATGIGRLGRHLTPLPHPLEGAPLRETGPYRIVRHPIYGGGMFMAFGWALWVQSWLTLAYAVILAVFLDLKARREERWLRRVHPGYADYARRVRKLVPFVY